MSSKKYNSAINKSEVSRILNRIMSLYRLTQEELARRLGISQAYVSELITGKKTPSPVIRKMIDKEFPFADLTVIDSPEPYGALAPGDKKTLQEIEELLRDADDDIKRHLRDEVKLLKRVPGTKKKRLSGED